MTDFNYTPEPSKAADPDSIESLDFTIRTYNLLQREGLHTIQAVAACTEDQLLDLRNFGQRSVDEVKEKLSERGLRLRPNAGPPVNGMVEVEHVTVYRWGDLQVTVDGDGTGHISLRDLPPETMDALADIMARYAEAKREGEKVIETSSEADDGED